MFSYHDNPPAPTPAAVEGQIVNAKCDITSQVIDKVYHLYAGLHGLNQGPGLLVTQALT